MKGRLINEGNTAEVFEWGDQKIIKLFREGFPVHAIEVEYKISKEVEKQGLPVPKVGEMVDIDHRKGIIYERIYGDSMLHQIMKNPLSAKRYAKHLADIHYEIHQCKVKNLENYKDNLTWSIRETALLSNENKQSVLDLLEQLPEGDRLCHADFHPGNIIVGKKQTIILDWMTASVGNPAADVARTILLLENGELPKETPEIIIKIITILRRRIAKVYRKRYLQISKIKGEAIDKWRVPIAAARLSEWIPESEKKLLLQIVEDNCTFTSFVSDIK